MTLIVIFTRARNAGMILKEHARRQDISRRMRRNPPSLSRGVPERELQAGFDCLIKTVWGHNLTSG